MSIAYRLVLVAFAVFLAVKLSRNAVLVGAAMTAVALAALATIDALT